MFVHVCSSCSHTSSYNIGQLSNPDDRGLLKPPTEKLSRNRSLSQSSMPSRGSEVGTIKAWDPFAQKVKITTSFDMCFACFPNLIPLKWQQKW